MWLFPRIDGIREARVLVTNRRIAIFRVRLLGTPRLRLVAAHDLEALSGASVTKGSDEHASLVLDFGEPVHSSVSLSGLSTELAEKARRFFSLSDDEGAAVAERSTPPASFGQEHDDVSEREDETSEFHLTARQQLHLWFVSGALIGGLSLVPWVTRILFPAVSVAGAWIGGILSAAAFTACFDSERNFKWLRALIAIGLAVGAASLFQHATGEPIIVLGGLLGFLAYYVLGSLFGMVGVTVLYQRTRKLRARIAEASSGETIVIKSGQYPAHLLIDKSLVLRAAGKVVLQGFVKGKFTIAIESEDPIEVTLDGFRIEQGSVGVLVGGQAHAILANNTVTRNAVGVIIRGSACASMSNNDISRNDEDGILLAGESHADLVRNEIVGNGGRGIALYTESCLGNKAPSDLAFNGSIMGEGNDVRGNEKADFCPPCPGNPWPGGFLLPKVS